jgi:predicted dehydrogenase
MGTKSPLRIGILGCANIARQFSRDVADSPAVHVVAVASCFETIDAGAGSGFRFAAEAFARVIAAGDHAAIDRAAQASLDNAATLDALARSAKLGQAVDVFRD